MKKIVSGLSIGIVAGIVDVTPMILQKLTWDANLSAFSMWVIIGVLLQFVDFKIKGALKGILLSIMVITPIAILIGWQQPFTLIPVFIMTIILGSLSGYFTDKLREIKNE